MDDDARPDEIEVFATGTTSLVERDAADAATAREVMTDAVRRSAAAVRDARLHERARSSNRSSGLGGGATFPLASTTDHRHGPLDVVQPVLLDPQVALGIAQRHLFAAPIGRLRLDDPTPAAPRRFLVWTGDLRCSGRRDVRVALHLYASPSGVVTVLSLVPKQRVGRRRAYLRTGIATVEAVADRLTALAR